MEDTKLPVTKEELLEKQGWKVIDLTETERVHASYYLEQLPGRKYEKIGEIIKELKKWIRQDLFCPFSYSFRAGCRGFFGHLADFLAVIYKHFM